MTTAADPCFSIFTSITQAIEAETNHKFIWLERLGFPGVSPDQFTRAHALSRKHILLAPDVFDIAVKFSDAVDKAIAEWKGGAVGLGNHIWVKFLIPTNKKAKKLIKAGRLREA